MDDNRTAGPGVEQRLSTPHVSAGRVAGAAWVRERLGRRDVALVEARSPEEFEGRDVRARRGGHIPGALTPDKTVVTYYQTHHRTAHTYFVLRLLGYPRVVAYTGSWAEWTSGCPTTRAEIERPR